jgi:hypothetical protein
VRAGLLERLPDRFALRGLLHPEVHAPACSLRVLPSQCVREGIIWQQVLLRPLLSHRRRLPSLREDRPDRLEAQIFTLRSPIPPCQAEDISGEADRNHGLRRFLVPVADSGHPLPLARSGEGPDPRLEPSLEIVTRLSIELFDATPVTAPHEFVASLFPVEDMKLLGTVFFELPVHEPMGRLAPAREHRELAWPDPNDILAQVSKPLMPPAHEHLRKSWEAAWELLCRLRRRANPHSGLPNDYAGTAEGGFHDQIFVWDSCFTTMAMEDRRIEVANDQPFTLELVELGGTIRRLEVQTRSRQLALDELPMVASSRSQACDSRQAR